MGVKIKNRAEKRKEEKKSLYYAKLNNCPTSPRKMRLIADLIRGKKVEQALVMLKNSPQVSSERLYTLLKSAISNWQAKNEGVRLEDSDLYIKEISVDSGRVLKRIRTAPQGRAHRIKKRSNHVTLVVDSRIQPVEEVEETAIEQKNRLN
ncbi:MAG: 50S ribosomal protein L22 [Bacteroidales bacterium]|jgi:large subunit ribosomal protein L22